MALRRMCRSTSAWYIIEKANTYCLQKGIIGIPSRLVDHLPKKHIMPPRNVKQFPLDPPQLPEEKRQRNISRCCSSVNSHLCDDPRRNTTIQDKQNNTCFGLQNGIVLSCLLSALDGLQALLSDSLQIAEHLLWSCGSCVPHCRHAPLVSGNLSGSIGSN